MKFAAHNGRAPDDAAHAGMRPYRLRATVSVTALRALTPFELAQWTSVDGARETAPSAPWVEAPG